MTVVWASLKDHQGYIDLRSRKGEGTTFYLYFPITKRSLETEAEAFRVETCRGNGQHLLVVDDVAEQREIAKGLLECLGYRVSAVACGEDAIAFVQQTAVDLLILDMIMEPGIDGLETYRRILAIQPNQKAIIASGYAALDQVQSAQSLGAAHYIKKPYNLEQIGRAVKVALSPTPKG